MALQLNGEVPTMIGTGGSNAGLGAAGGTIGGLLAGGVGGALAGALLGNRGGGNWGGNGGNWGNSSPLSDAAAASVVISPEFRSLQNQIDNVSDTVNHAATDRSFDQTQGLISSSASAIQNSIANLSTAQATSAFTTLQSINDLGRDVTAQANQNALQQLNSFNQQTTSMLQGFNNSAMQIQNTTNQIIAQGTANAAANAANFCQASRELAQCCCEVKQLIKDDGNLTRALINDNTIQALRDKNTELQVSVSNNVQNQYLLNTILTHLPSTSNHHD